MYNASFYPTPPEVAHRVLSTLDKKRLASATILEPSAGKGDLADAALSATSDAYGLGASWAQKNRDKIHCVEIEPELQAALLGKGYPLVGTDFLTFWPDETYDLIVMNPPFAEAEKHLLHAWEILDHGDILCLVNEQTILNPCTSARRQLARLVSDHGEVTHLGSCFKNAFRKTDVRVSLIHLTRQEADARFSFLSADGMDQDPYAAFTEAGRFASEVATRDLVSNLVSRYDRCREIFLQIARLTQELGHYSRIFPAGGYGGDGMPSITGRELESLMRAAPTRQSQELCYNRFVKGLKRNAWFEIFRLTELGDLVSDTMRDEMMKLMDNNARMAFSVDNIARLLETLFLNRRTILNQCILEAFDHMTRYHKENRLAAEGWKTNDAWRVNERVVLPGVVDCSWPTGPNLHWNQERMLDDIDRGLAFLNGKKLSDVPVTMRQAVKTLLETYGGGFSGVLIQSTHFEMRCYKKGTLHLKFLDRDLWERFNLAAAKGKNWLPDDYKAREKENRARNRQAEQYGLPLAV